jgi:thiol-disulfide isomerase/thioredoxin
VRRAGLALKRTGEVHMFAKGIASALLLTGLMAPAVAEVVSSAAPELPPLPAASWINSRPLELSQLRGRPVLVEFWTFACSNCRNTLPWLKQVHAEFAPRGLVVIAVHSPEFDRERGAAAVERAVRQLGIDYPVMVDDDFRYWNALGNRYWPAFYLIGPDGRILATRVGELHAGQRSADEFSALIAGLAVDPATSGPARR